MDKKILEFLCKYTLSRQEAYRPGTNPALKGIYYKDGQAVACNGSVFIVVNTDYEPSLEGYIIPREGPAKRATYPDYKTLISRSATEKYVDISNFLGACENLKRPYALQNILCVEVDHICLNPSLVLDLTGLFRLLGEDFELYIQHNAHTRLQSENCTILIAPYLNVETANNLSVINALEYGDLL